MVEVRLFLNDRNERAWFGERLNELEAYREAKAAGTLPSQQPAAEEVVVEAEYTEQPEAEVIATITPEGVTTGWQPDSTDEPVHTPAPADEVPSTEKLFDVLRNFVRVKGYAAARAVLDSHKVDKITDPINPEIRIKLLAELSVEEQA